MMHDKLITNHGRGRKGFASSPDCSRCHEGREDVLHAVRGDQVSKEVWRCIVTPHLSSSFFFNGNLREWLLLNLKQKKRSGGGLA